MITVHWKVPLLRVPVVGALAVHDCRWLMKSGKNEEMLKEQVAVLTPASASAMSIVHTTGLLLAPTLIVFGLKSNPDSDGTMMSSGTEVTASVATGANCAKLPTWSKTMTWDVQVPASAYRGIGVESLKRRETGRTRTDIGV